MKWAQQSHHNEVKKKNKVLLVKPSVILQRPIKFDHKLEYLQSFTSSNIEMHSGRNPPQIRWVLLAKIRASSSKREGEAPIKAQENLPSCIGTMVLPHETGIWRRGGNTYNENIPKMPGVCFLEIKRSRPSRKEWMGEKTIWGFWLAARAGISEKKSQIEISTQ